VLDGRFMVIEQAMATVHGPVARAALAGLIEELKASGFIARELAATGQTEASVAPAAAP
jgi:polar amino acid transport system substrate-binding protein